MSYNTGGFLNVMLHVAYIIMWHDHGILFFGDSLFLREFIEFYSTLIIEHNRSYHITYSI